MWNTRRRIEFMVSDGGYWAMTVAALVDQPRRRSEIWRVI